MNGIFGQVSWGILNCSTGEFVTIPSFPFEFGSSSAVDWKVHGPHVADKHCSLRQTDGKNICLVNLSESHATLLNSGQVEDAELVPNKDYTLQIGRNFFAIHGSRNLPTWRSHIQLNEWLLQSKGGQPHAVKNLEEVCLAGKEQGWSPTETIVSPRGLGMGFYFHQVLAAFEQSEEEKAAAASAAAPLGEPELAHVDESFTCPVCWLKFDPGDAMHIAVHEALRGDTVLGEDAAQRFHATRFNDAGFALDAMGLPCNELACPHCRRKLPTGFLEAPHHIFSIVGVPSAGKSYYLTSLVKVLPPTLYKNFGVVFQDADPAGNAPLNRMKDALFNATSPEQALLVKTVLEGEMYERLPRYGRVVALPRPFIFNVSSVREPEHRCSLVFYDNAGEHFEPGRDSVESPGAQHVASSSGIFFLFDPTANREFRERLSGHHDPQLARDHVSDQQDVVLTETSTRIRKLLNLRGSQRISTPLAILVGKCDVWLSMLNRPVENPLESKQLNQKTILDNSNAIRELLLDLHPSLVANAESLSDQVCYFPVSAFGHSPVKLEQQGETIFAPDPKQLKPIFAEVPILWALSKMDPTLVPMS